MPSLSCCATLLACIASVALVVVYYVYVNKEKHPQHIHLAATGDPTEMVVTWVTFRPTDNHSVEYNVQGQPLTLRTASIVTKFIDGGSEKRVLYVHRVKLTGLAPSQAYDYRCGTDDHWSDTFTFKTLKDGVDWSPRMALYGDLGSENGQSLTFIEKETERGDFDSILHVGDFAYNMDTDNSRVGDKFMNQIQPIATRVPYMTCPGNHEHAYNFSNYKNRFSMPGQTENMFYSWNIGPAHIISFSTEFYFFPEFFGTEQIANQFNWLEADLKEAAKESNRKLRPWIITMGHRPMYCSNADGDDCTTHESVVRTGISSKYGLEDLFYLYGVDLMIWAHEHSYERLYPVYNRQLCKGPFLNESYINPCAPVHITTGSAGCSEHHDAFRPKYGPWTAFRSLDYGYTRMTIHNNTHLYLEQVSADKGGEVIDKVLIIKHHHPAGPLKPPVK